MNGFDDMPPDVLRKVIEFQSASNRKYRKLFIDGRMPSVAEVADEAPELCMVELDGMDAKTLLAAYTERQARFDTAPFDPEGHSFRLFPGGLTIWSGFPGTGKTTLLRQLICQLLFRGRGVFLASLEEAPDEALVRLCMTAAGTIYPTAHQLQWLIDAHSERLRMWGMVGFAPYRAVLGAMRYAIKHEGCQHVVIDSLTCLDIGGSDWDGQRGLANELCALARSTGAHIHLVAHPRKPSKAEQSPDIADIAGSSDLGRLADNVIFVQRTGDESQNFTDATPMRVIVKKQRHGTGMCGQFDGWFHRHQRQFDREQFRRGAFRYLPDDAYDG